MPGFRRLLLPLLLLLALLAAPFSATPALAQSPAADGPIGTVIGDVIDDLGLLSSPTNAGQIEDLAYDTSRNRIYAAGRIATLRDGSTDSAACGLASLKPDGSWDNTLVVQSGASGQCAAYRLLVHGNYLYVGLDFSTTEASDPDGTVNPSLLYRIDLTTNRIDRSWLPTIPGDFSDVRSLLALPTAGGTMIAVGLARDPYFLLIDSADASSVTPVADVDGTVNTLYLDGSTLYVGGGFTAAPAYLRRYTWSGGSLTLDTDWAPLVGVDGISPFNSNFITGDDTHLYVHGGSNGSWRGPWRIPLSGDGAGSPDTDWRPNISKSVDELIIDDQYVYIIGEMFRPYNSIIRYDLRTDPPTLDTTLRVETGPVSLNNLRQLSNSDRLYDGIVLPAGNGRPRRIVLAGSFESLNGISKPSIGIVALEGAGMPSRPTISGVSGSGRGPYTISGRAQAGMQIVVYDAAAELGTTTVNSSGSWSFTTSDNLAVGGHDFTAVARYPHRDGRVLRSDSARSNRKSAAVLISPPPANRETVAIVASGSSDFLCENPIDGDDTNCNRQLVMNASEGGNAADGAYPPQQRPDLTPADLTNSRTITVTNLPAQSASLTVRVFDADWPTGEMGEVFLNDRRLGYITGSDTNWSTTVFDIPDLDLIRNGANQVRFRPTNYDNPWDSEWNTIVASVVLLIDGGEREHGEITSTDVPEPSGSISTSNVAQIKAAEGLFLSTAGLLNADGQIVAEVNVTATTGSSSSPYSWPAATLESSSDDYIGWTVRHALHYWDAALKIWVLQDQRDLTYTGLELSVVDGSLVATLTPHLWLRNIATGSVTFFRDGNEIGSAELALDGTATLDLGDLPDGVYDFSAVYSGDDNFWGTDAADSLDTTPPPVEENAVSARRCDQLPDMAVSPQFITLAPGGSAQVEIALRNLCNDALFGPADVLLSLSDGLSVSGIPNGWLNLGRRAVIQNLTLQPGETVRYLITVTAAASLPTAPLHISELYVGGQVVNRIDGVFLLPEGTGIGAPAAEPTVSEPAPSPAEAPALPITLPNTAAAPGSLPWLLLISGISVLLVGMHLRRRLS
jgi:hypothetical protein